MRASFTAIVVLTGTAVLLVGCGQTTAPTSPTSVQSIGTPGTHTALTSVASSPVAFPVAAQQVPFKGKFHGSDAITAPGTITTTATGTGTHLGQFLFTHVITIPTRSGSAHWVAANGDSIDTTSVIVSSVLGPVVRTNTENHTITGGTGRFSDAEGSFTVVRTHVLVPSDDGTHVTSGSFEGTITSAALAH